MSNKIKFAGPSKRMREALEAEGLSIDCPSAVNDESDLSIEGLFVTGMDWEKCVFIDLRDEGDLSTKANVDAAISNQLDEAYEAFSVTEEFMMHMQGTESERKKRGVPEADRLLQDMEEQADCLKRFAEVAEAVANGRPVPPKNADSETIRISHLMAEQIKSICNIAMKYLPVSIQREATAISLALNEKLKQC